MVWYISWFSANLKGLLLRKLRFKNDVKTFLNFLLQPVCNLQARNFFVNSRFWYWSCNQRQNEDKGKSRTKQKANTKTRQSRRQRQNKYTDKGLLVTLKPTIKDSAEVTVKDKEKQRHRQGQYQTNTKTKQKQRRTHTKQTQWQKFVFLCKFAFSRANEILVQLPCFALLAPKVLLEYLWPMITIPLDFGDASLRLNVGPIIVKIVK